MYYWLFLSTCFACLISLGLFVHFDQFVELLFQTMVYTHHPRNYLLALASASFRQPLRYRYIPSPGTLDQRLFREVTKPIFREPKLSRQERYLILKEEYEKRVLLICSYLSNHKQPLSMLMFLFSRKNRIPIVIFSSEKLRLTSTVMPMDV